MRTSHHRVASLGMSTPGVSFRGLLRSWPRFSLPTPSLFNVVFSASICLMVIMTSEHVSIVFQSRGSGSSMHAWVASQVASIGLARALVFPCPWLWNRTSNAVRCAMSSVPPLPLPSRPLLLTRHLIEPLSIRRLARSPCRVLSCCTRAGYFRCITSSLRSVPLVCSLPPSGHSALSPLLSSVARSTSPWTWTRRSVT